MAATRLPDGGWRKGGTKEEVSSTDGMMVERIVAEASETGTSVAGASGKEKCQFQPLGSRSWERR